MPGTVFKGHWRIREFLREALHKRDPKISGRIFTGANDHAAELISIQRKYAESASLQALRAKLIHWQPGSNRLAQGAMRAC